MAQVKIITSQNTNTLASALARKMSNNFHPAGAASSLIYIVLLVTIITSLQECLSASRLLPADAETTTTTHTVTTNTTNSGNRYGYNLDFNDVTSSLLIKRCDSGWFKFCKTQIQVLNAIASSKIKLYCMSEDDDFGYHFVEPGQSMDFAFYKKQIIGQTIFQCHFWWGRKYAFFDIYNASLDLSGLQEHFYWKVVEQGFYLSRGDERFYYFQNSWTVKSS